MKRVIALLFVVALSAVAVPSAHAKAKRLDLTISNFRFCEGASCTPLDAGYLRTSSGPAGLDNPQAVIDVKRGTNVYWIYRDSFCDMLGCPGHNVIFENGTPSGSRKGFIATGGTGKAIKVRITQKVGTTIRYFCSVNNHYETGMTGILQVV